MRKKTDMCRAFQRGDCGWGSDCNYAHDEEECRIAKRAYELYKICGTVRIVTNSSLKPDYGAVMDSNSDAMNSLSDVSVHIDRSLTRLLCNHIALAASYQQILELKSSNF